MGTLNSIKKRALKPGRLIRISFPQLPSPPGMEPPAIWFEHLGDTNVDFVNWRARRAGMADVIAASVASTPEQRSRMRDVNREAIWLCSARRLERWFWDDADGNPDPKAPILGDKPEDFQAVVFAIPDELVDDVILPTIQNAERFRDPLQVPIAVAAEEVAKKS